VTVLADPPQPGTSLTCSNTVAGAMTRTPAGAKKRKLDATKAAKNDEFCALA
jgi:hypothetical protein